jgi:multidrug efflux system outer membrane protein
MSHPLRLALLSSVLLTSCVVGPRFEPPVPIEPDTFRGTENTEESFADLAWFEVFRDPALQGLVRTALRNNYDVRIAAERVIEARARYTIINSGRYPDVDAFGVQQWDRAPRDRAPSGVGRNSQLTSIGLGLSWDLDFWGRYTSASDAARAELLATEFARVAVLQFLVTDLALAYFELLELDSELAIAQDSLGSRSKSVELVSARLKEGVANKVELRQAQQLVLIAASLIPILEQAIERQENFIRLLVGDLPGPVQRGDLGRYSENRIEIPAGLPSQVLTRRPDIQVAELKLIAANARIGEAKALLYPSVSLTASGGAASQQLGDLLRPGSGTWSLVPSISLPIFNAGRLSANVEVTESLQRQAALQYLATLQRAFREVADALIGHTKSHEARQLIQITEETLADQVRLSKMRYRGGVTAYFEVLDSEREHFDSELALARAIRDELTSTVRLYRALGGGWQGTSELAAKGVQEVPVLNETPESNEAQTDT